MSYAVLTDAEARAMTPRVVHVDENNRVVKIGNDPAEPVPGSDQRRGDDIAALASVAHIAQPPRRRQVVGRHVIIEAALAVRAAVDALGDAEGDCAAEHRPAAVAGDA